MSCRIIKNMARLRVGPKPASLRDWLTRKNVAFEQFCVENDVSTRAELVDTCARMGAICDVEFVERSTPSVEEEAQHATPSFAQLERSRRDEDTLMIASTNVERANDAQPETRREPPVRTSVRRQKKRSSSEQISASDDADVEEKDTDET